MEDHPLSMNSQSAVHLLSSRCPLTVKPPLLSRCPFTVKPPLLNRCQTAVTVVNPAYYPPRFATSLAPIIRSPIIHIDSMH
jgi:hypothetical protein